MKKTVVINVVGLSQSIIGKYTPFITDFIKENSLRTIIPVLPAVTTTVQSTYLTGKLPSDHGIIGNGWYDRIEGEVKFWKQSNKLVKAEKIWEKAKKQNQQFTCANICWWYNMHTNVDYSVTPRPNYLADGRKIPDCYSQPENLRTILQNCLGDFPLFNYWGPKANIKSSRWIADAAILTDQLYNPTLSLVYLPHLDYCLQKNGDSQEIIKTDLIEIDNEVKKLVNYYENQNAEIIILSEYGIAPVSHPIDINRILRQAGFLKVRIERGLELLDTSASNAFAVADHQIAHIYVKENVSKHELEKLFYMIPGIEFILDKDDQVLHNLNHERSGDFVLVAKPGYWFTYYYWLNDNVAPDFARCVDIHKKPGYDPVEMFMTSKLRAAYKLLRKKLGLRYVMDVIPLNAKLVKGSHGNVNVDRMYYPIIISSEKNVTGDIQAINVYDIIWDRIFHEKDEVIKKTRLFEMETEK